MQLMPPPPPPALQRSLQQHNHHYLHFFQPQLHLPTTTSPSFCFHGFLHKRSSSSFLRVAHKREGVRCAATKQKKKKVGSKKVTKGPEFEEMMIVWDDIFGKFCEDSDKVEVLRCVGREGLQAYGRGCVLVHLAGRILPRGAGRGFLSTSKPPLSSAFSEDPPPYHILQWAAAYVPREFLTDPMKALDDSAITSFGSTDADAAADLALNDEAGAKRVALIGRRMLLRVLRGGMDKTRLLSLTGTKSEMKSWSSESTMEIGLDIEAAGGEKPYEPNKEEIVVLLAVDFGGTPVVGADVMQAFLDKQFSGVTGDTWSWKLKLRNSENIPF